MSDRVELTCPCCGTELVADAGTGEILSEVPAKRFDELRRDIEKRAREMFGKHPVSPFESAQIRGMIQRVIHRGFYKPNLATAIISNAGERVC